MSDKQRIIDLQKQTRIARQALEKIKSWPGEAGWVADKALDDMMALDKPTPLAGILGWGKRT